MTDRRVAFVTGARRGIGRATAFALAEAGFDVVVNDIEEDQDSELAMKGLAERGARGHFIKADIGDIPGHARILDEIYEKFGRFDCLVNNAATPPHKRNDILEAEVSEFDRLVRVNLRAPFFLTQAVALRMIADGTRDGRSIVTITSANAVMVSPEKHTYCVTKAGLSMTAQLYAVRLAEYGIPVFEIRPGMIITEMSSPVRQSYGARIKEGLSPIRRWGVPEDVGKTIANLASGAITFSIGQAINVDGGLLTVRL